MRKIATIIFALCAAVCLSAQGIPDGTYTFAFRLERTKTQGTYRLAKATEFWAKTQPLESRPARSIIEQTNLSLMRSELKVTEAERSGIL